jgi:hypothetical protein
MLVPGDDRERILPLRHTSAGWAILDCHWSAVPGYDFAAASKGLSAQAIQTELEIDFLASTGKVVYPEFSRIHISPEPLPHDPRSVFWVGLDMPGTPAAIVSQLDVFGRWCILSSLAPPENETIGAYAFGEALAEHLHRTYAAPHGLTLWDLRMEFVGDPAGWAKIPRPGESPQEARSCFEILRDGLTIRLGFDEQGNELVEEKPGWGWEVQSGAVSITDREEAVRARLKTLLNDGVPALVIDPSNRTLIEGMSGAHCYKQLSDGRYELRPFKGRHSHVVNAMEYPATVLFPAPREEDEEEEDDQPRREFKARARGRTRSGWR